MPKVYHKKKVCQALISQRTQVFYKSFRVVDLGVKVFLLETAILHIYRLFLRFYYVYIDKSFFCQYKESSCNVFWVWYNAGKLKGMEMRILNLYAGVGGNRKLWGNDHDITAIEKNIHIAEAYKDLWPKDKVVAMDAHKYLLENYKDFDFIWSSPPCPTHSRARYGFGVCGHGYDYVYPDMALYQEVILLKHQCRDIKWVVENVLPYYAYLIEPSRILGRHAYWANFFIEPKKFKVNGMIAGNTKAPGSLSSYRITGERAFLKHTTGFDLDKYSGFDKRKSLRNCVEPEAGLHILNCAVETGVPFKEHKKGQMGLFEK